MPEEWKSLTRPRDDDDVPIGVALAWQRDYVMTTGSTTAALILEAVADDIRSGGRLADLIPAHQRFGDLPGLRVMAAVHRLALQRQAPAVAMCLPTLGGTPPGSSEAAARFRRDVVSALLENPSDLAASLARTPQTNETGRAALLRCALSREEPSRPVRLREIGASAGLNLRADQLPGDPALEVGSLPPIVDRVGCDLHPVDITTTEGRALLGSYIWVDDVDRFDRLSRALDVAARVPAVVLPMDAASFVEGLSLQAGTATVLWDSAMWVYLPGEVQHRILAATASLGSTAGPDRPFVHVSWEWAAMNGAASEFALVTRRWDGGRNDGRPQLLATGMSHGASIELAAADTWLAQDPLVSPSV